jgi:hypothetical protein
MAARGTESAAAPSHACRRRVGPRGRVASGAVSARPGGGSVGARVDDAARIDRDVAADEEDDRLVADDLEGVTARDRETFQADDQHIRSTACLGVVVADVVERGGAPARVASDRGPARVGGDRRGRVGGAVPGWRREERPQGRLDVDGGRHQDVGATGILPSLRRGVPSSLGPRIRPCVRTAAAAHPALAGPAVGADEAAPGAVVVVGEEVHAAAVAARVSGVALEGALAIDARGGGVGDARGAGGWATAGVGVVLRRDDVVVDDTGVLVPPGPIGGAATSPFPAVSKKAPASFMQPRGSNS